jgi:hypothetical protein
MISWAAILSSTKPDPLVKVGEAAVVAGLAEAEGEVAMAAVVVGVAAEVVGVVAEAAVAEEEDGTAVTAEVGAAAIVAGNPSS